MSEVDNTIQSIRDHELSIERHKNQIATVNEQMREVMESLDEFDEYNDLNEQLKLSRERLKQALSNNQHYVDLMMKKSELQETLNGHKHILSEQLVAYYGQTKERQIEMNSNGDARAVVLTGKLGKSQKYQQSLLHPMPDMDMPTHHQTSLVDEGVKEHVG